MNSFSAIKIITIIFCLLQSQHSLAQKKEKVKGSKILVTKTYELEAFNTIEIDEKLEINLIPALTPRLEIEADDNLFDVFQHEVTAKVFKLRTNKNIASAKKVVINLYYTNTLKQIFAKEEVVIKAINEINLPELQIIINGKAKVMANVKVENFRLVMDYKSKMELNLTTQNAEIDLNKNAELKALIYAKHLKVDMYQKATGLVEGDVENLIFRIDNSVEFTGKKLTANNISLKIDNLAKCSLFAKEQINIEAAGRSETAIYGNPSIIIDKFTDDAVLLKKSI